MKKIIVYSLAILAMNGLWGPILPVYATEHNDLFCDGIAGRQTAKMERLAEKQSRVESYQDQRKTNRDTRKKDGDLARTSRRQARDQAFQREIDRLLALAGTDANKKAAVVEFQQALTAARTTSRVESDKTIATFRSEIDKMLSDRKSALLAAHDARKTAFNAAYEKAKSDCAAKTKPVKEIRETFQAELDAARAVFKTAVEKARLDAKTAHTAAVDKRKASMDALNKTRTEAVRKAEETFRSKWGV